MEVIYRCHGNADNLSRQAWEIEEDTSVVDPAGSPAVPYGSSFVGGDVGPQTEKSSQDLPWEGD